MTIVLVFLAACLVVALCFRKVQDLLKDEGNARLVQTLGIVFTFVGVLMAWYQLRDTNNALRATTALQIQRDGRELLGSMNPKAASYIYAFDPDEKYDPTVIKEAQIRVIQILNYYASASRQHDYGTIDDEMWNSVKWEFCKALKHYNLFQTFWAQAVQKKIYRANFLEEGQKCLGSARLKP